MFGPGPLPPGGASAGWAVVPVTVGRVVLPGPAEAEVLAGSRPVDGAVRTKGTATTAAVPTTARAMTCLPSSFLIVTPSATVAAT